MALPRAECFPCRLGIADPKRSISAATCSPRLGMLQTKQMCHLTSSKHRSTDLFQPLLLLEKKFSELQIEPPEKPQISVNDKGHGRNNLPKKCPATMLEAPNRPMDGRACKPARRTLCALIGQGVCTVCTQRPIRAPGKGSMPQVSCPRIARLLTPERTLGPRCTLDQHTFPQTFICYSRGVCGCASCPTTQPAPWGGLNAHLCIRMRL